MTETKVMEETSMRIGPLFAVFLSIYEVWLFDLFPGHRCRYKTLFVMYRHYLIFGCWWCMITAVLSQNPKMIL